jgi:hypothetical protein
MRQVTIRELIGEAATLLSEDGENPEYDRALAELVTFSMGLNSEHVEGTMEMLRKRSKGKGTKII